MLKKLYVDNFRCLVNFELNLTPLVLLMGLNGSGKSNVFEVLFRLRQFITGELKVGQLFFDYDRTKWQTSPYQTFNLEVEGNGGIYLYQLVIEHDISKKIQWVKTESLRFNNQPLFDFQDGTAKSYRDDYSLGAEYPFDWFQSGIASIFSRNGNKTLMWFKDWIAKFIIVGFQPTIWTVSNREEKIPSRNMDNFSSWYRYFSQEHQGQIYEITQELRKVMPGFHSLGLPEVGLNQRALSVGFTDIKENAKPIYYFFHELSDGQRVIIMLYALLYGVSGLGYSLFLDEPENFLALPEIKPWLMALEDFAGQQIPQVVLISHHPEMIDYLGASAGVWLEREENSPARVKYKIDDYNSGLALSESVARGWIK